MITRHITFGPAMMGPLHAGTKTQTRRLAWREGGTPSAWQQAKPGERCWVKEAWRLASHQDGQTRNVVQRSEVGYATDTTVAADAGRLRSARCMPRWASRITLVIADVRIQRLHDIDVVDVLAEGCPIDPDFHDTSQDGSGGPMVKIGIAQWRSPRAWYHLLWDSIYEPGAWDKNPEVVALTFAPHLCNVDKVPA